MRELYPSRVSGTASWNDASNNKAFLSGQVGYTNNSISVYAKAVVDRMAMADGIEHAYYRSARSAGRPSCTWSCRSRRSPTRPTRTRPRR